MRARTAARVAAGGRLVRLECAPPLTLRRVHGEPGSCALCLVGTAAGPLPGDDLALSLVLEPGATVTLSATGASIAQGRGGPAARTRLHAAVGANARLDADPGALVVCAGAHVDVEVALELDAGAQVCWRELVVLGRSTDPEPGRATVRWDVTRAGRPVLRQLTDLADPVLRDWTGNAAGHRVLGCAFVSGPDVAAATVVRSASAVAQRIDESTALVTVLGNDADTVGRELDALLGGVLGRVHAAR